MNSLEIRKYQEKFLYLILVPVMAVVFTYLFVKVSVRFEFPSWILVIVFLGGIIGTSILFLFPKFGVYLALIIITVEVGVIQVAGFGIYLFQPIVMLTATGILIRCVLGNGRIYWPRTLWPIVLLWASYIFSAFFAIDRAVTIGGIVFFIPLLTFCWLVALVGRSRKELSRMIQTVLWIGVAIAIIGILQSVGHQLGINLVFNETQRHFLTTYQRPSGLQMEPNWFGIYTGMVWGIAFPLWIRRHQYKHLQVNVFMLSILSLAVLLSGTRSVWVAIIVSVLFVTSVNLRTLPKKISKTFIFVILLIFGAITLILTVPQAREPLSRLSHTFNATDQTSQTRINTWLEAWEFIEERPLTGYGLSAWEVLSQDYNQPGSTAPRIIDGKSVPNIFLENWLSSGLLGIILIIVLLVYYSVILIRLMRQRTDPWISIVAEALLSGWVVVIVASFFTNAFKHNWFWIVVSLINGLAMVPIIEREKKPNEYPDG